MQKLTAVFVICVLTACASDDPQPMFRADYTVDYVEVRNCRMSSDHDFRPVRILADPAAKPAYLDRTATFPVDSIVLKEEFEFGDNACAGPIQEWTVMRRTTGSGEEAWDFQRVDAKRKITDEPGERCINCHTVCGRPPDGFDGTCAVP